MTIAPVSLLFSPDPTLFGFGVEAIAGQPDYFVDSIGSGGEGGGRHLTGIPLTSEGIHCELTLLGGDNTMFPGRLAWIMTITPLSPGSKTYTFTGFRENVLVETQIGELGLSDSGGGFDPVFFNNISVGNVPEPGGGAAVVVGAAVLLRRRGTTGS